MANYDRPPAAPSFFNGKLYQKVSEDLQLAGMSKRTVHGYLRAVRQLADHLRRYDLYAQVSSGVWKKRFVNDIKPVGNG